MLERVSPIVPVLYQAIEKAGEQVRNFFATDANQKGEKGPIVDPYLAPALLRFYAKHYLDQAGHDVEAFGRDDVPNNGLLVRWKGLHLKILKAHNGGVPPPGDSEPKQDYYNQQLALLPSPSQQADYTPIEWNLLVLWDASPAYEIKDLILALPKFGRDSRVETHWSGTIPYPILGIEPESSRDDQVAADDLDDMSLRRDKETGEGD
jgi:hypothetical protein